MIDFQDIAMSASLPDLATKAGIFLKQNGREYQGLCIFHQEKTPSFQIYPSRKGGWNFICFGCGQKGNAIDFCMEAYGVSAKEAANIIAGDEAAAKISAHPLNPPKNCYDNLQIGRPPDDAYRFKIGIKSCKVFNAKRNKFVQYTPKLVHNITDKHDSLLGHVLRIEIENKKLTPSIFWALDKNTGQEFWANMPYPGQRPLYGLGKLYQYPERQVILCEGEKTRDAADRLLGDKLVAVSWLGGTNATHKAYWQSLTGRSIILFPDLDDVGKLAMFSAAQALKNIGCTIKQVDVFPEDIPEGIEIKGYDLADTEHLGYEWISNLIRKRIRNVDA